MSNYVKLKPHTDVAALEKKLPAFIERYAGLRTSGNGVFVTNFIFSLLRRSTPPGDSTIMVSERR